ncbi:MAG: hypothetical protein Q9M91_04015 [Candidatus Dojkabacteria bacterium]|nr:hypothetical protein [Candidatus Dojkabacteria bacterium]
MSERSQSNRLVELLEDADLIKDGEINTNKRFPEPEAYRYDSYKYNEGTYYELSAQFDYLSSNHNLYVLKEYMTDDQWDSLDVSDKGYVNEYGYYNVWENFKDLYR